MFGKMKGSFVSLAMMILSAVIVSGCSTHTINASETIELQIESSLTRADMAKIIAHNEAVNK